MNKDNTLTLLSEVVDKLNVNVSSNESLILVQNSIIEDLTQKGVDNIYDIVDFYTNVALACHVGRLSIDRSSSNFKFGFAEVADILHVLQDSTGSEGYDDRVKTQLVVSDLRAEFLSGMSDQQIMQVLVDDIATVRSSMGIDISDSGASDDVKGSLSDDADSPLMVKLKENSLLSSRVEGIIEDILKVYDDAFTSGYELEPYEAVVLNHREVGMLEYRGGELAQPVTTVSHAMAVDIMSSLLTVKISRSQRQIDLQEIYESKTPVYFPLKIAEFALGLGVTSRSTGMSYQKATMVWKSKSKDKYSHRDKIEEYLSKQAWRFLELVTVAEGFDKAEVFQGGLEPMTIKMSDRYEALLLKFASSMCTFAVLKKHVGGSERWASAEWVVSAPSGYLLPAKFDKSSRSYLQHFNGEGEIQEPLVRVYKGVSVMHYTHVANAEIAESEPLFAYKALEALNNKGEKLSIHNQLLGRGLDGRLITSNPDSPIYLGNTMVTAINSGSRSGKGVMTANAMATSVVEGRPIFGADRKPDTFVPFYEAFGGQDENGTPRGYFIQGGAFSASNASGDDKIIEQLDWNRNPKVIGRKERLVPSWMGVTEYNGFWGDMAYYRHTLLTMGILALRSTVMSSNPELYAKLNGNDGVMIIYDEITNWIRNFSLRYLSTSGLFGSGSIFPEKKARELKELLLELDNPDLKDVKRKKLELDLEEYRSDEVKFQLYNKDLFEKLDESRILLDSLVLAGFKGIESVYSDVYIIGQDLYIEDLPKLPRTVNKDPASFGINKPPVEAWVSFLYQLNTSFIVGYNNANVNASKQAWRSSKGSDSGKYLTESARRFAYFGNTNFKDIRDGKDQDSDKANSVDSYKKDGAVYFKPYLILGSHKPEDQPIIQMEKVLGSRAKDIRKLNSRDGGQTWDERVGIIPYLNSMGAGDISASFVRARKIAEMVIHKMGYEGDYLDFLLDLRPEWNFSVKDVVDAFVLEGANENRSKNLWYNKIQAMVNGESTSDVEYGEADENDMFAYKVGEVQNQSGSESEDGVSGDFGLFDEKSSSKDLGEISPTINEDSGILVENVRKNVPESTLNLGSHDDGKYKISDDVYKTPERQAIPEEVRIPEVKNGTVKGLSSELGVDEATVQAVLSALLSGALANNGLSRATGVSSGVSVGTERLSRLDRLNAQESSRGASFGSADGRIELSRSFGSQYEIGWTSALSVALVYALVSGYDVAHTIKAMDEGDLFVRYGDDSNVSKVSVIDGVMVLNGYKVTFDVNKHLVLPRASVFELNDLKANKFGNFFPFGLFASSFLSGVRTLEFSSANQFVESTRGVGAPIRDDFDALVARLFDFHPSLQVIFIGDNKVTRADVTEKMIASRSIFGSYQRRHQVIGFVDNKGGSVRRSSWSRAKKNYNEGHTLRSVGNTAVAGVGLGVQGVSKVASGVNTLVTGAGRLAKAIAQGLADDRNKVRK